MRHHRSTAATFSLLVSMIAGCHPSPQSCVTYSQGAIAASPSIWVEDVAFGHREQLGDAEFIHQVFPDALRHFSHLKRLSLAGTEIGDPSLQLIAQLESLEILSLYDTKVTATGLKTLSTLPKLRWLDVPATVTDEELSALQATMPRVSIHRR